METIKFIKQHGVNALTEQFAIIVKEYDDLYVLNYNQIDSPKNHPIVKECRSLILDKNFNVVSRSFDRFLNHGESPDLQEHIDLTKCVAHEKVDGSLIKIYFYNNKWNIATRGTAYAESKVNGFDITFHQLVLKALDCDDEVFQKRCAKHLDDLFTYIFEVTAMENRVVTRYEGYKLHFLACRENHTGNYIKDEYEFVEKIGAFPIKHYSFSSIEECILATKELPNLEEGYVIYQDGVPVCKVKSPAYVTVHAIRGEGLNPKRISQLVLMNEVDEYLSYFPEDKDHFTPYTQAKDDMFTHMNNLYNEFSYITSQKEFAQQVASEACSAFLFQARKSGDTVSQCFNRARESFKIEILQKYLKG